MKHNVMTIEDDKKLKEEVAASKTILQNKDLLITLDDELSKKIVGEEDTRKTILIIGLGGRLVKNASPTSSNLMVNDESGAGKDYVVKSVLSLIPKKFVVSRKRISPTAFTYWHNALLEPSWTWEGLIFYNEDISSGVLNSDVFKVMSSSDGENTSTIVDKGRAIDILIRGKPVMIITTYSATPGKEILRRFPILNLDTGENQTKAIIRRKAELSVLGENPDYDTFITKSLQLLKPCEVKIPYAELLTDILSTHNIIIRTHFDRLIDYIKYSAAIHQYQREQDPLGFIIANLEDYEHARMCFLKTTTNQFSIPLTKNQKKILAVMKEKSLDESFSVTDLEPAITFISDRTLRKELDKLADMDFLHKDTEKRMADKPVIVYKLKEAFDLEIPDVRELEKRVKNLQNASNSSNSSSASNSSNSSNSRPNEPNEPNEQYKSPKIDIKDSILKQINALDKGSGVKLANISKQFEKESFDLTIKQLLEKGDLFEVKPGIVKTL